MEKAAEMRNGQYHKRHFRQTAQAIDATCARQEVMRTAISHVESLVIGQGRATEGVVAHAEVKTQLRRSLKLLSDFFGG